MATLPTSAVMAEDRPVESALSFAEVYRDYLGFVWRNARALGVGPSAIDDIVQEIFVVVHRRLPEFEGRAVRTWLYRIVLNVVRHHRRTIVRRPHDVASHELLDPETVAARAPGPDASAELSEDTLLLQRLLELVDEEKREVLVLAEIEELTVPEIAEALGINVNTTYSRLRVARQQFEKALARHRAREAGRQS